MNTNQNPATQNADASQPGPAPLRAGFIKPQTMRGVSFVVTVLCLLVAGSGLVLGIWDQVSNETLWRLLATVVTVMAGTGFLAFLNTAFGK